MKIAYVVWRDSVALIDAPWKMRDDIDFSVPTIHSAGILVEDTDDVVALAIAAGPDDVCGTLIIPRETVVTQRILEEINTDA